MKRILSERKLAPGVTILGDGDSCIVPAFGGAVWVVPGAEIEALPYALRELLTSENPDNPPERAMPLPNPPSRPAPCRPLTRIPQPNNGARKGHPVCGQAGWCRGFRISRRR
jgi:hypothetical protein